MPLASEFSGADGGYYYCTITNTTEGDGTITVDVTYDGVATDPISGTTIYGCLDEGSWAFDETTGIGPFNSFYAAFDPYNDNAMIGILNPYDLTKLIDGGDISWMSCNIMWVIPTVHWYTDSDGSLILTNDPSSGDKTAYAHMIDGHVYGYIAIGVYEAYVTAEGDGTINGHDSGVLTSWSGKSPTGRETLINFRTYASSQKVVVDSSATSSGHALVWNFYQWELYKYCCVAAMASWDSQSAVGNGYSVYNGSSYSNVTGLMDQSGPYAGSTTSYTDSVKLFIENAWGSLSEFVDGVLIYKTPSANGLYLYLEQSSSPSESYVGLDYVYVDLPVEYNQRYAKDPSTEDAIWGFPTDRGGSADTGLCDILDTYDGYYNELMVVGGDSYYSQSTPQYNGLSYMSCSWEFTGTYSFTSVVGTRLAFVFDAGDEMTGVLSFNANGGSSAPASMDSEYFVIDTGYSLTIGTNVPTYSGHMFLGWSRNPDATEADYTDGTVIIWGNTTLYAVWQQLDADYHSFNLEYNANGGSGPPEMQTHAGAEDSYDFIVDSVEPTRSGYKFLGWATSPSATTAQYFSGDTVTVEADETVILYAVWESDGDDGGDGGDGGKGGKGGNGGDGGGRSGPVYSYTVSYDANGGTGAPATLRYTSSSARATLTITFAEPIRSGYTFVGWSTDPDATTPEYHSAGTITLVSDGSFSTSVTLYAVWTAGSSSGSGSGSGSGGSGGSGSGGGSGDGGSGSGSGSGSGGSDGRSDNSDWWIWILIILIIIILVAISGYMGYRARNKD